MARCSSTVWNIVPQSIDDLFNRWSNMASNDHNSLLLTAASTLCWAVWITRNEVVFDKCRPKYLFQLFFQGNSLDPAMGKIAAVWWSTGPANPSRAASRDVGLAFLWLQWVVVKYTYWSHLVKTSISFCSFVYLAVSWRLFTARELAYGSNFLIIGLILSYKDEAGYELSFI